MEKIKIGKIVNFKGLKGEMKIYPYTDYAERFEEFDTIYISTSEYTIEDAMVFKNKDIYINKDDLRQLDDDEFLISDIIGLDVYDKENKIGVVKDVLTHTAQHIYVVKNKEREILIPAVEAFIKEVNIEEGFIKVELIEGF